MVHIFFLSTYSLSLLSDATHSTFWPVFHSAIWPVFHSTIWPDFILQLDLCFILHFDMYFIVHNDLCFPAWWCVPGGPAGSACAEDRGQPVFPGTRPRPAPQPRLPHRRHPLTREGETTQVITLLVLLGPQNVSSSNNVHNSLWAITIQNTCINLK